MKLYPLPALAVLALAGSLLDVSPAAASPAPAPSLPGQNIYTGSLQNGWQYFGWAKTTLSNPAPALSAHSIKVQEGPWQAVYLHHTSFQTTSGTTLSFWINGGPTGGQTVMVEALRKGVPQTLIPVGPLAPNVWQHVQIALPKLGVDSVSDMDGLWFQNYSAKTLTPFYLDQMALTPASSILPTAPAAPTGLTATPQWAPSCPVCGGMPMAHVLLAWNTVPGAASYTVYRDGVKQSSQATNAWTDMTVVSGQAYTYTVTATGPGGESTPSAPATATAPLPPVTASAVAAPTNVTVSGAWTGALTQYGCAVSNTLGWTVVPGAASYNVYQSDVLVAQGLIRSAFTITPDIIEGNALYTVTAVDGKGMESLPSAPAGYMQGYTADNILSFNNYTPTAPDALAVVPEWNLGAPRIVVSWHSYGVNPYNIYRDGTKVDSGLWRTYYVDADVQPGSTHSYTVSAQDTDWLPSIEGPQSAPITVTALSQSPVSAASASTAVKVQITKVVPDDDSAVVFFTPIPGATDYRLYDVTNPAKVKYAGNITQQCAAAGLQARTPIAIQWNGIDPAAGADLVVQAVDKFGPFEKMDGSTGNGTINMGAGTMGAMGGMTAEAINGQGDPSNVPNVLAQSDTFHVACAPVSLTGDQAFFDNCRSDAPLVKQPNPAPLPGSQFYGDPANFDVYTNDKWEIRQYGTDLANSKLFFMGGHFMDTTYDGGGVGSSDPPHNNDASMVMLPKQTADISGGKVLHVTFEVDAHMDSRRWCELMIGEAGDPLIDCAKFEFGNKPTVSGKLLRWQIQDISHSLTVFEGDGNSAGVDLIQPSSYVDGQTVARISWDHVGPLANGTMQDLDKRHRFDLYLSKTHYRLMETTPDGLYNVVREKDFPAGVSLPFDKCQVYFVHQIYHTSNDLQEQIKFSPYNSYWPSFRPFSDERHWDNLGFEVLNAFPALATS